MRKTFLFLAIFALTAGLMGGKALAANLIADGGDTYAAVGEVTVTSDGTNLVVTFTVDTGDWVFVETHLHVAKEVGDIPQTKKNNPKPGNFDYDESNASTTPTEHTYTIPFADIGVTPDDDIFVAAHAAIKYVEIVNGEDDPQGDRELWDDILHEESAWGEGPEFAEDRNWAMYIEDTVPYYLNTGDGTPAGTEAGIVIDLPPGTTLGDIASIFWLVYTVTGYPPHIDITLDVNGDGIVDPEDMLTGEMNLNCVGAPQSIAALQTQIAYDSGWLQTFELTSGDGFDAIDDSTIFWVTKMGSGNLNAPSGTLADWKAGVVANDPESEMTTPVINGATPVVKIEIEIDNWVVQSAAYVKGINVN